jgi:hypothetical protein
MIIIQTEDGAIITNPKEIYIDKDLDGHLHIYADLSNTDRIKAVKLTVNDYSEETLGQTLEMVYKMMNSWLYIEELPHYVIRMRDVLDVYKMRLSGKSCSLSIPALSDC